MDILHFTGPAEVTRLEPMASLPEDGFVWLDFAREQEAHWASDVERLCGVVIHERHINDSFNLAHPTFFDGTAEYDMLIFRGLSPGDAEEFITRPTVFILREKLLITVRAQDSKSVSHVKSRMLENMLRIPARPVGLMHLLLTAMVDRFLAQREPLTERFESWREGLLDPKNPFDDWNTVLSHTTYLRKLEYLSIEQKEALLAWREETDLEFDDHLRVRFTDLQEHIDRVRKFAREQKGEAESLVQLHFSAVAHRTNEIMRMLTVLSAIFLPLSFIAGVFGMNFEYMPELKTHYGYFFVLGGMFALAIGLLVLFRRRRWI